MDNVHIADRVEESPVVMTRPTPKQHVQIELDQQVMEPNFIHTRAHNVRERPQSPPMRYEGAISATGNTREGVIRMTDDTHEAPIRPMENTP